MTVTTYTDTSVSLKWNCPCQEWSGVDRYEFEFKAEDGQVDFTHTSRTSGIILKKTYFIIIVYKLYLGISNYLFLIIVINCASL